MADESNPVISIIMPVKDGQLFIAQAIDSVLAQTYKNFELIIVNDGSTDQTTDIIDRYSSIDYRIKFISLEKNHGVSVARNKGLECATGRYVSFIDSDDILASSMIERLIKTAEFTGADVVLANYTTNLRFLGINNSETSVLLSPIDAVNQMLYQKNGFDSAPFAKLFNRNLFNTCRFKPGIRYEDLLLLPEIYLNSNKIAKIDDRLYYYRKNLNGFMFGNSEKHTDLLYVTDTLKQELLLSFPTLGNALLHRRFSALMNILKRSVQDNLDLEEYDKSHIIKEIKQLAPMILKDGNSRLKNRIGALFTFTGIPTLKFVMRWL